MAIVFKSNDPNVPDQVLHEHQKVEPLASYSPWNKDLPFLQAFQVTNGFSLVDIFRSYELWQLVEQSAKLPAGDIIEIGVWRGGTGVLMAHKARLCNLACNIYLCDTFTGVVKTSDFDEHYNGGEHADTSRETVETLAGQFQLDNIQILEGIFPEDTGSQVADRQFRLVHVDVDVYQSAKDVVEWVWDKLVPGGIVVYDDFGFSTCGGITTYVEEQMALPDRLVMHNLNGHAVVIKL